MRPVLSENSKYLVSLLRAVLHEENAPEPPEGLDYAMLFAAADAHSLAPMVYHGLYKSDLEPEKLAPFLEAHRKNMKRSVLQEIEMGRLCSALDERGMDYCPLKGWYTRLLYPETSMRVMSDVDMLIREKDRDASKELMEALGYECIRFRRADDDKYKRHGLLMEFHTGLDADGLKEKRYYADPWRLTERVSEHCYKLGTDDEYLYSVAHAMKHFMNSGAGLRFLIDIYLYLSKAALNREYIERSAEEMGIERFLACMERTAMAAFGDGEFDEDTSEVFVFMLESGVGGTNATYEASRMIRSGHGSAEGTRSTYLLQRIFPPVSEMKYRDPILQKAPVLLPFMYVRRWFQLLFSRRDRLTTGLEKLNSIEEQEIERLRRIHEIAGIE